MVATQQQVDYISGRKRYTRPQGVLFTESYDVSESGLLVPTGSEYNSEAVDELETFMVLSDHNRGPIDISFNRIETRERMVNGRMRSYHVADKKTIRLSWNNLPSRSYASSPDFRAVDGGTSLENTRQEYTVDGGAGGADIKRWYDEHVGSFYVLLAYDNYADIDGDTTAAKYQKMNQYTEVLEMFISDFSHSVEKRGSTTHDLWSVSMSLEEA